MEMRTRLLVASVLVVGAAGLSDRVGAATSFAVTNNVMQSWRIGGVDNPTLTLTRGQTYNFVIDSTAFGHPFWITSILGAAEDAPANAWTQGVTNNGGAAGTTVTFVVPASAPSTLFYQCSFHQPMEGTLNIVAAATSVPSIGPLASAALAGLLLLAAVAILRRRARA
jgi:hypothetical protein